VCRAPSNCWEDPTLTVYRSPLTTPPFTISLAHYYGVSILAVTRSPSPIDYESTSDQTLAAQVEAPLANPRPGRLSPAAAYALHRPDPSAVPVPFVPKPVVPPGYDLEQRIDIISIGVDNDQTLVNNTPAPPSPHFPVPPIPAAAYRDLPFILTVLLLWAKTRTSLPSDQTPVTLRLTLMATQTTTRKKTSNQLPTTRRFEPLLAFAMVTEPSSTCTNTASSLPAMIFA